MGETKDETPSKVENETPSRSKDKVESQRQVVSVDKYEAKAGMSTLNLFDDKQLAAAEVFLGKVMKSSKGGITSVADGLAVLMRANDLGLPFSTCIEHIHVINGKTGIDIHIVKALLSRAGCTWELVKDYQPLYEYTDGINVYNDGALPEYVERCKGEEEALNKAKEFPNSGKVYAYPVIWYKDFKGNVYKDYNINLDKMGIAINKVQVDYLIKNNKVPIYRIPAVPVDYVSEYIITRLKNGKEFTAKGRFSYTEAHAADLFTKDTYIKYARTLIGHRAFTYAAREIASDILFGVMETTELKIVSGAELTAKDFGDTEDTPYTEL